MIALRRNNGTTDFITDTAYVTLRARSGSFLSLDGLGLVTERKWAYRANLQQARAMRKKVRPEWALRIEPYSQHKG